MGGTTKNRAVVVTDGANLGRRNMLALLGTLPAVVVRRPLVRRSFDDTVFYLHGRFRNDVESIAAGPEDRPDIISRMSAYAQAMAIIPASDPRAIAAKVATAHWTLDRGPYTVSLAETIAADLIASADDDSRGD